MRNDRATVLYILKILQEESDEGHILSMKDIQERMKWEYETEIDRRTVASAINALNDCGYDICTFAENRKGYYLRERDFEISELRLLMDAIFSFRGIPAKQTSELITKIQKNQSRHQQKQYKNLAVAKSEFKTPNREVFYTIETLDEAITNRKKVTFRYAHYDFDMTLKPKSEKRIPVDPWLLLVGNDHYYLIGNHSFYNNISHYRLDRITDIEILDDSAVPPPSSVNLKDYATKAGVIYFGDEEQITYRCKRGILDDVIDEFGTGVMIYNINDETFDFTIRLPIKPATFFALKYISRCELLAPEKARERMRRYLKAGEERYLE